MPSEKGAPGHPFSSAAATVFECGRFSLSLARPLVMGIVNVTADSFSDGGRFLEPQAAIAAVHRLVAEGADIVDIGAESTRPRALPMPEDLEWQRLAPVLDALASLPCPVSVDTRHPSVMRRAIEAGAAIINDVEGFRRPGAVEAVAASDVGLVAMHMKGEPGTMQDSPTYGDVVGEVYEFLERRRDLLQSHGVGRRRIALDPGFGFGKSLEHNMELLRGLGRLHDLGCAVLVGLSRKSMVGELTRLPVDRRLGSSIAAALAAVARGARIVRVHDVAETVGALRVWQAVARSE